MMYQPRPLTSRSESTPAHDFFSCSDIVSDHPVWNTIRPKMLAMLEEERQLREEERWSARISQLQEHYNTFLQADRDQVAMKRTLPSSADAVQLPCMQTLLKSTKPDAPLLYDHFVAVQPTLLEEAEDFRKRIISVMAEIIRSNPSPSEVNTAARTSGSTTTKKGKGTRDQRRKDSGQASNMDDDVALLNASTSLFTCNAPVGDYAKRCPYYMSYLGLLEHWQTAHSKHKWTYRNVHLAGKINDFLPRLIESLGVEANITHAELSELLMSGRPTCSCGQDPMWHPGDVTSSARVFEQEPKSAILGRLVRAPCAHTCDSLVLTDIAWQLVHVWGTTHLSATATKYGTMLEQMTVN